MKGYQSKKDIKNKTLPKGDFGVCKFHGEK